MLSSALKFGTTRHLAPHTRQVEGDSAFFREQENSADPSVLNDFKRHITEFLEANRGIIRAQRILVDFHVSSVPVPHRYIDATEEVLRLHNQDDSIQDVVIFT